MSVNEAYQGQHNPPHPGEFIQKVYLEPLAMSRSQLAKRLKVSASAFSRLVSGDSDLSPEMALRLSCVLGRSARSWMAMQDNYDLWHAAGKLELDTLQPIETAEK